jgi:hypothetical protein
MAGAPGSCDISEETFGTVKKIKWSFTAGTSSSDSNIVTPTTTNVYNGKIQALHTVGGTSISASYDITILDGSSIDVLLGAGANRSSATEHTPAASLGCVANDTLTLTIDNTGDGEDGAVYLFIR